MGTLEPARTNLNGPSAKVLDNQILAPLGFTRNDAWLCDLLPETRLNSSQINIIHKKYEPQAKFYGLNEVTIPRRPSTFCNKARSEEITSELEESQAETLILLGDIPIIQYMNRVAEVDYKSLQEYVDLYGYGHYSQAAINGKTYSILPLAHPRQIGALGAHSEKWYRFHQEWENNQR
jgi:hypothetical protein